MDLSKLPTDVIPYISAHLTDSTVLNESLRSRRADTYLLYFFFHKNIPKDAKQYNKLLNDEAQYYKYYDFTYNNKRDVTGLLKTIKTKYKQLKLRTYDLNLVLQELNIKYLYKALYKRRTRYKKVCSNIKNDIKYFMKQCLTFQRLQFAHVLKF